jgi:hypothetical protein
VVKRSESEANYEYVIQKANDEYADDDVTHFKLHRVWRILKDSKQWQEVEIPSVEKNHAKSKSKRSKT